MHLFRQPRGPSPTWLNTQRVILASGPTHAFTHVKRDEAQITTSTPLVTQALTPPDGFMPAHPLKEWQPALDPVQRYLAGHAEGHPGPLIFPTLHGDD